MMLRCKCTGAHENWLFWGVPILTTIAAGAKNLCDYPARVQSELEVPLPAHKFAVQFSSCNSVRLFKPEWPMAVTYNIQRTTS